MTDERVQQEHGRRALHLVLVAVIAAAFIGYFIGIDYGVPKPDFPAQDGQPTEVTVDRQVIPATGYSALPAMDIGPNRNWSSDLRKLKWSAPELNDVLPKPGPQATAAALEQRAERRAYNGAPPVIPHAVNELSADNCLACHGEGLKLANRSANQLPHPYLANCMQCHVPQTSSQFETTVLAENTFDGKGAPFEGPRAWPGAPPQIPHTTHMRDNCLACHGPLNLEGLRTTHPWRQNCMQCHTPSAELDQNFLDSRPAFLNALQVRRDEADSSSVSSP